MNKHQKPTLPVQVSKVKSMPLINKRSTFYFVTAMVMLWGASIVMSS